MTVNEYRAAKDGEIVERVEDYTIPASYRQVGGQHYKKHRIQPLDIIDEYKLDFYLGSVLKYILRDKVNKAEDIDKAIHFLELYKERVLEKEVEEAKDE